MISAEALAALAKLEHGARYNTMHSIARELMREGFACNDWGYLSMTEAGRIYLRRGRISIPINGDDDYVSDMSAHIAQQRYAIEERASGAVEERARGAVINDPMAPPHHVQANDCQDEQTVTPSLPVQLLPEEPPQPLPVAESRMQEMLRAAGVASGKTGTWVDAAWLAEFVRALDEGGVFSGTETSAPNTP